MRSHPPGNPLCSVYNGILQCGRPADTIAHLVDVATLLTWMECQPQVVWLLLQLQFTACGLLQQHLQAQLHLGWAP